MMKLFDISREQHTDYVALLTEKQKDELVGKMYMPCSYFNPIQDADDNWFISIGEVAQFEYDEFMWVKDLPLIPYNPKIEKTLI